MQKIIRWLRNNKMDILLVAAFVMVAFVVSNAGNLVLRIQGEIQERNEAFYENGRSYYVYSETGNIPVKHLGELCAAAKGTDCKVATGCALRVGDGLSLYDVEVVIQEPVEAETKLLLGKAWKKYTYEQEGKRYILLGEVPCEVSAFLADKSANSHDARIVLYYDRVPQELRDILDRPNDSAGFSIESHSDISEVCKKLRQCWEKDYGLTVEEGEYSYEDTDEFSILYLFINKTFVSVLLVFVLIHSIMISELWIGRRKEELVIRRAFGYSRGSIVGYVLKKFAQFMLVALGVELVLQLLYQLISGGMSMQLFWEGQGLTMLGMMVVVLFIMAIHIFRLTRLNVAELIREE